jgi:hypothetical protein
MMSWSSPDNGADALSCFGGRGRCEAWKGAHASTCRSREASRIAPLSERRQCFAILDGGGVDNARAGAFTDDNLAAEHEGRGRSEGGDGVGGRLLKYLNLNLKYRLRAR